MVYASTHVTPNKKFFEHRINPAFHNTEVPMSFKMTENGRKPVL